MARTPMTGPTLDTVAALAGVSKATVSKVLNGRPGTAAATRERVERVIRDLGYTPSTHSSPTPVRSVTVVFDSLISLYSLRVMEGMVAASQHDKIDLVINVLTSTDLATGSGRLDSAFVKDVAEKGHAGIIAVTSTIEPDVVEACADSKISLVAVDPPDPLNVAVVSIGSNHWTGGWQATNHLIELGHRRIAFVGGDTSNRGLRDRLGGYRDALRAASIPDDPRLISEAGMETAETAVMAMVATDQPPSAVFATTDGGALGAIRGLSKAGLRVPGDVSVVGYDDTYSALPTFPSLTTIHTPMPSIGRTAVETLLRLSAGARPLSHHIELATTLVIRESTAPAHTAAA